MKRIGLMIISCMVLIGMFMTSGCETDEDIAGDAFTSIEYDTIFERYSTFTCEDLVRTYSIHYGRFAATKDVMLSKDCSTPSAVPQGIAPKNDYYTDTYSSFRNLLISRGYNCAFLYEQFTRHLGRTNVTFDVMASKGCPGTDIDDCTLIKNKISELKTAYDKAIAEAESLKTEYDSYVAEYNQSCQETTNSTEVNETTNLTECKDSDRGFEIYTQGLTKDSEGTFAMWDACDPATGKLYEFTCTKEGDYNKTLVECPYGCEGGACIGNATSEENTTQVNDTATFSCSDVRISIGGSSAKVYVGENLVTIQTLNGSLTATGSSSDISFGAYGNDAEVSFLNLENKKVTIPFYLFNSTITVGDDYTAGNCNGRLLYAPNSTCSGTAMSDLEQVMLMACYDGSTHILEIASITPQTETVDIRDLTYAKAYDDMKYSSGSISLGEMGVIGVGLFNNSVIVSNLEVS
ncbi:hypothetical protein GF345_04930 [Candidatus Woesearchaeota archaeon]|nr:hypothetical protein [Candidatus Woesearchaeota archaeon]